MKQETVGQKLYQARIDLNQSDIENISQELCIRPHLLKALEQDDFDKFPSACYAAGFLKIYVDFLGLGRNEILTQYEHEFKGSHQKVILNFPKIEKNHHYLPYMVASFVIISALTLFGVLYKDNHDEISMASLPDISEVASNILISAQKDENPARQEIIVAEIEELPLPEKPGYDFNIIQQANASAGGLTVIAATDQILLSVRDDTWLRILDGENNILVERVVLGGEEFYLDQQPGMTMMTSNAGAVSIYVDGNATVSLGQAGEIRHNISLDKNDLLLKTARLTP